VGLEVGELVGVLLLSCNVGVSVGDKLLSDKLVGLPVGENTGCFCGDFVGICDVVGAGETVGFEDEIDCSIVGTFVGTEDVGSNVIS